MRILVDTCVRQHANSFTGEWESHGTAKWGGKWPIETGGIVTHFKGRTIKKTKGGDQNGAIGALAREFMNRTLTAITTDALMLERIEKPASKFAAGNYGDVNLFAKVEFESICSLKDFILVLPGTSATEELRSYLSRTSILPFSSILHALGAANSQDAWHLHCCFVYELDAFLTVDTALLGRIRSISNMPLRQQLLRAAMLPTELCRLLDVVPLTQRELGQLAAELGAFPSFGTNPPG